MSQDQNARLLKVRKIFRHFDLNRDDRLSRDEMAALVVAVNPRVKFSDQQIGAILDEVFRTYRDFIEGDAGLSFDGLLRTYEDGAGDIDRDFDALRLGGDDGEGSVKATASSIADERAESVPVMKRGRNVASWATSANDGIACEPTWGLVEDLVIIIKRLKAKMDQKLKQGKKDGNVTDLSSEGAWSRDLGTGSGSVSEGDGSRPPWEDLGQDYINFQREVADITRKADDSKTQDEAFDAHMAIGRTLFDHALYKEAVVSFKKATELKPADARPHFRLGNASHSLGRYSEAIDSYVSALNAAKAAGDQWKYLLPRIHVNLGIALEGEGMLLSACEHYREAADEQPQHHRALKLLGSALYGVGEFGAAEKALIEATSLKSDYADAHCDLGSTLHAMRYDDRAIHEFQKAIDLKPDHTDALYNLGGLFRGQGRWQRAAEMYSKVLALQPGHWRAQLNKAVALLGAGETEEARKAFKEALKMTNRVELYDAILHLKLIDKRSKGSVLKLGENSSSEGINSAGAAEENVLVIESSHFRLANAKTTPRLWLSGALHIRQFQRHTRLNRCDVTDVNKEFTEGQLPVVLSDDISPYKSICKEDLEKLLRRLLHFLKPETFQGAVRAINEKILSVLNGTGSRHVDVGMFFAVISPICAGSVDKRKQIAFNSLVWRSSKESEAQISKSDASAYLRIMRAIYLPAQGVSAMMEVQGDDEQSSISFPEFLNLFDDPDWGFGILNVLVKLEASDHIRHSGQACVVCSYPIIGPWFKEVTSNFSLCSLCYSEGKVPSSWKKDEYCFKEYNSEGEAARDRLRCFSARSTSRTSV